MWTRKLLKANAKIAFRRNFWACVAVSFLAVLLGAASSGGGVTFDYGLEESGYYDDYYYEDEYYGNAYEQHFMEDVREAIWTVVTSPIFIVVIIIAMVSVTITIAFMILVANIVNVGHKRYYLENREHKTDIGKLFYGFSGGRYGSYVWIMFWKGLYTFLWSLLFVIPGIVKSYSYMMIPYILAENPSISKERAFEISKQMMKGHKGEAFVLGLSFFGWQMLNTMTSGILGVFYVNPYVDATFAEFYSAIKAEAFRKGITNAVELPGVGNINFAEQFTQQL